MVINMVLYAQCFLYIAINVMDKSMRLTSLGKTKMASGEIDPQPHKNWPSVESLKAFGQKTFRRHYYLSTLPRPSIPSTEGKWNKSY